MIRIGHGEDFHRLEKGRAFILGGVEIPFEKGPLGHSDGDALSHAIADALLGAAALGDIGTFYPPSEEKWEGASSIMLLKKLYARVQSAGWHLLNLDCTILCEKPKIAPYRQAIRESIAKTLDVDIDQVFIKGKTREGLGAVGRGEAIEAFAVCLIQRQK